MQLPSPRSVCVGTALVFAFLIAAPAAALPITGNFVDDARRVADIDDWVIPTFADDRDVLDDADDVAGALNPSGPTTDRDDDRFKFTSSSELTQTSAAPLSVPEPGTLVLAGMGAVVSLRRARARR